MKDKVFHYLSEFDKKKQSADFFGFRDYYREKTRILRYYYRELALTIQTHVEKGYFIENYESLRKKFPGIANIDKNTKPEVITTYLDNLLSQPGYVSTDPISILNVIQELHDCFDYFRLKKFDYIPLQVLLRLDIIMNELVGWAGGMVSIGIQHGIKRDPFKRSAYETHEKRRKEKSEEQIPRVVKALKEYLNKTDPLELKRNYKFKVLDILSEKTKYSIGTIQPIVEDYLKKEELKPLWKTKKSKLTK